MGRCRTKSAHIRQSCPEYEYCLSHFGVKEVEIFQVVSSTLDSDRGRHWFRVDSHPGGNPGANLNSISRRCNLFKVALVWELTEETIVLPLGCLQGSVSLVWRGVLFGAPPCPCSSYTPSSNTTCFFFCAVLHACHPFIYMHRAIVVGLGQANFIRDKMPSCRWTFLDM